VNYGTRR